MIGLGVGIDYALFIVTRYRQGLHEGRDAREATVVALQHGRPGGVVCGWHRAHLVARAVRRGAALHGRTGRRRHRGRAHGPGRGPDPPARHAGLRRPGHRSAARARAADPGGRPPAGASGTAGAAPCSAGPGSAGRAALLVLVVLALPLFSMRLAFTDAGNDPPSLTTRQAYDLLAAGFGPGFNGPLVIAADVPAGSGAAGRDAVEALDARLASVPGVASVTGPVFNAAGDAAVIIVYPTTSPQAAETASLVRHLRSAVIPPVVQGSGVTVLVGGVTAAGVDASHYLSQSVAAGDRAGHPAVVLAADDGVPVHRHSDQSRPHEPPLHGRGLRSDRGGVPVGMGGVVVRREPDRAHRSRGSRS